MINKKEVHKIESNKKFGMKEAGYYQNRITCKEVTGVTGLLRTGEAITYEAEHIEWKRPPHAASTHTHGILYEWA